jgi:riboflavin kinase/FMN adenylyltransferase
MRVIRGLTHLGPFEKGCVMTIGNFDGLHLGHQTVIHQLLEKGRQLHLPTLAVIFEPQPLEYFLGEKAPPRLMRLREKILYFSKSPIHTLVILPFKKTLADYDANLFIETLLVRTLNVKYLVIGHDFHFGKNRQGNFALLKEKGKEWGFEVDSTAPYQQQGHRISSTLVRNALQAGELQQTRTMLGRDYSVCGRVAHGDKRGRLLGFPTANIKMFRKNSPINGVFAITMTGIHLTEIQGIANIGTRPTFTGNTMVILEVHLFNFNQMIYGHYVEVSFKTKIRDEKCFHNLTDLKQQITHDIVSVKDFFKRQNPC